MAAAAAVNRRQGQCAARRRRRQQQQHHQQRCPWVGSSSSSRCQAGGPSSSSRCQAGGGARQQQPQAAAATACAAAAGVWVPVQAYALSLQAQTGNDAAGALGCVFFLPGLMLVRGVCFDTHKNKQYIQGGLQVKVSPSPQKRTRFASRCVHVSRPGLQQSCCPRSVVSQSLLLLLPSLLPPHLPLKHTHTRFPCFSPPQECSSPSSLVLLLGVDGWRTR